jgi:hypothetical protein
VLATAHYFIPILALILVVCGALEVSRHRKITYEMIDKYFMGNGMGTWFLSPLNLIADLFSYRNKGQYSLADLPEAHRDEIEACVCALLDRRRRLAQCSNQREFLHTVSLTKSPIRVLRCFRLISPFLSQSCTSNAMLVLLGLPACSKRRRI